MANVLKLDCVGNNCYVEADLSSSPYAGPYGEVWVEADVAFNATLLTALASSPNPEELIQVFASDGSTHWEEILLNQAFTWDTVGRNGGTFAGNPSGGAYTPPSLVASQFYRLKMQLVAGTPATAQVWIDGVSLGPITMTGINMTSIQYVDLQGIGLAVAGAFIYFDNFTAGTTDGGTDIFTDDFEGDLSAWNNAVSDASIIADPGITPSSTATPPPETAKRVGIAFDDGPLAPDPTYTYIDGLYENLVSGYDIQTGKQTELDRTDTGTATVYLNDTLGLFDPLNTGSTYFGKLVGKQIILQLWNPVTEEWVQEWQGKILDYGYAIKEVLGGDGKPILATIQIDCVDIFDYLGSYGLQPGVNGDTPPAGQGGTVFYEDTLGTVDDRIIQVLTEALIDSTRYVVFSGNVKLQETKYDPGDAMLNVLRDAADAEFPGLANIYVDRFGRFVFHGRYARFDPEGVIAGGPISSDTWDFHRWKVGDGTAITGDSDYAQIRVLAYSYGESDIVNSAISWPAGMADTDMPGQVFEDATSIGDHGKHSLPPMGDLVISEGSTTMNTGKVECAKFAEFFVHYLKDPQTRITSLMVKAIGPDDPRASSTWDVLCKADISDIMRTTVGYPGGVGIDMDNYIEGYTKRVRPLNPTHDYVEVEFNLTPTAWAMDPDGILAAAS